MSLRIIMLIGILLSAGVTNVHATERFFLKFEFMTGNKIVNKGNAIVSSTKKTWQKGLQRSFLTLSCHKNETDGTIEKIYATIDHFTGLEVTHQLVGDIVELRVVKTVGIPRLTEIRALHDGECKDLSPLFTTTTQEYRLPVSSDVEDVHKFDEKTILRTKLQAIGGTL